MVYVTMTDKFMSGWGMADRKINKLIFECKDYEEAEIVSNNAHNRTDMIYINICTTKPYYSKNRYYAQIKTKDSYNSWYEEGYFLRQSRTH